MSCNADKAVQELIRREVARRQAALTQHLRQGLGVWAKQHGMPSPIQIGASAVTGATTYAISEALRPVLASMQPKPTTEARDAAQSRYLERVGKGLDVLGVSPKRRDEIVADEACLIHVANALADGELLKDL